MVGRGDVGGTLFFGETTSDGRNAVRVCGRLSPAPALLPSCNFWVTWQNENKSKY